jgi:hypothetical protein
MKGIVQMENVSGFRQRSLKGTMTDPDELKSISSGLEFGVIESKLCNGGEIRDPQGLWNQRPRRPMLQTQ